ncbi:dead-box helicase Rs1 [Bombus vancouverensis nearcticus]|uniref:RNA helicase n=1 Tax=Bombus bifarius TaxID=103933 RepID=A0A6P8M7L4_9HYME|nr:probable ATP-dependent RNA helicase DDX27 [Bombus vancouverensis nearcticus]XP_033309636.1 probable ATP-dependent RNA helicase DDX27 [Bombus bifarius]XP_050491405.1 probable ATP-dependent RNA helicase DDX27 [Bombus huntii]
MDTNCDLIKTIEDDQEVPNFSEDSDVEDDFQPRKQKKKENKDFDNNFQFVNDISDYNKDTWNDLNKYIKRKAKTKLDDKIKRIKRGSESKIQNEIDNESNIDLSEIKKEDDELSLSEDELRKDIFKTKEKKSKKKVVVKENDEETINFEEYSNIETHATFYQMNLSRPLLKAITAMNFVHPTPIQAATIPVALMGRDICGCAATGTGKTAAYMLPTLERLLYRPLDGPSISRVLVLVPTRELGVQVYQVTKQLSQFTTIEVGLSVGGLDVKVQEAVLRKNPDIVIATPGRLIDHLRNTPSFSLDSIEVLILDEADRMLDEYFAEQMKYIVKQCSRSRQTILFSATMTEEVKDLAAVSLDKPVKVFVDSNQDVAFNLRQEFIRIRKEREGDREAILAALICRTFHDHVMVFVQTKKQAHRLHILLGLLGIKVGELHGNLTQPQRLENLTKFKNEEIDILLATDVAARGLDISGVKTVINFVMPVTMQHYIHRVGRTARAGRVGVSVSLAGEQERSLVKEIIKNAKNPVKNRIILPDIIDKYSKKLQSLETDVNKILEEERNERELAKIENQANRAEKLLKNESNKGTQRTWFQTQKERKEEKEKLSLTEKLNTNKGQKQNKEPSNIIEEKKKRSKEPKQETAEDRAKKELEKIAAYQARLAKKKNKQNKIRTVVENDKFSSNRKASLKRPKSSFAADLTNTSKKAVKKMRYEANVKKNQSKRKSAKSLNIGKKDSRSNFKRR